MVIGRSPLTTERALLRIRGGAPWCFRSCPCGTRGSSPPSHPEAVPEREMIDYWVP
jgi:hypothetical protein